eukprot:GFYU01001807.1.p1 GENE.GFYU01001807.1~~GFYU01001807.1.p1  ORF type:complete len:480 (+),score=114.40 GFYU01001807.1:196-1635(+)
MKHTRSSPVTLSMLPLVVAVVSLCTTLSLCNASVGASTRYGRTEPAAGYDFTTTESDDSEEFVETTQDFIREIPKADLQVMVAGMVHANLAWKLAQRNNVHLTYDSREQLQLAYGNITDFRSFWEIYDNVLSVFKTSDDFEEVVSHYARAAASFGVTHIEPCVDVAAHVTRGLEAQTVIAGTLQGLHGHDTTFNTTMTSSLLLCFQAHTSVNDMQSLTNHLNTAGLLKSVKGIGVYYSGRPYDVDSIVDFLQTVKQMNLKTFAYLGDDIHFDPSSFVRPFHVDRFQHSRNTFVDPVFISDIAVEYVPMTVTPMASVKMDVFHRLNETSIRRLEAMNLPLAISSSYPGFFGPLEDNWIMSDMYYHLPPFSYYHLAIHSFTSSFTDETLMSDNLKLLARVALVDPGYLYQYELKWKPTICPSQPICDNNSRQCMRVAIDTGIIGIFVGIVVGALSLMCFIRYRKAKTQPETDDHLYVSVQD